MNRPKWNIFITLGVMIGIIVGLIIAANFDFMLKGNASEAKNETESVASPTANAQVNIAELEKTSQTTVEVVKRVSPTVVTITSKQRVKVRNPWSEFFGDDFFRQFGGRIPDEDQIRQGLGSGVIITSDGYIVTNNHVVEDADELVVMIKGEEHEAKVIGADPQTDVAVVKVNKNNLPFIKIGDSDRLEVGEIVLAIGSPFSKQLDNTVTMGIVSAKGRRNLDIGGSRNNNALLYQDFIQTDAAINPGNSGGALVNLRGELVGINTAIIGQANVGIGFAIPINLVNWVKEQIITSGSVTRGYLGVQIGPVDRKTAKALGMSEPKGAFVHRVEKDTPAEKAGIQEGDVILEFDGKSIVDQNDLTQMVAQYKPGTTVKVKVVTLNGKEKTLNVKLMTRPVEEKLAESSETADESALGIQVENLTPELKRRYNLNEDYGVVVVSIRRDSPAFEQGLREGDLIMEYGRDRVKIESKRQFNDIIRGADPGDVLLFRVKNRAGAAFIAIEIPEKKEDK